MTFENITPDLQNIILSNHSYMTKWFVFILIIILSCFYIWGVWPNHKPTTFITQAMLRLFFFGLAVVYLAVSPLMILLMTPEYSFNDWYLLPLNIYSIFLSIGGVLVFVDILKSGLFYLLNKAGLDLADEGVDDIRQSFENSKHFLKMKKGGKDFGRKKH